MTSLPSSLLQALFLSILLLQATFSDAFVSPLKIRISTTSASSISFKTSELCASQKDDLDWVESGLQLGRSLIATVTLAGVLFLSPDSLSAPNANFFTPQASWAEPSIEQLAEKVEKKKDSNVLDEVWSLIGKYYIDRTFNGQVCILSMISDLFVSQSSLMFIKFSHILHCTLYLLYLI